MIKLLCIDLHEYYEMIDQCLLATHGIHVIVVCQTKAKQDQFQFSVLVSSLEFESLLEACRNVSPDFIWCGSERLFEVVAKVRQRLGISGMTLEMARLLGCKHLMYQYLDGIVAYPRTTLLDANDDYETLKKRLSTNDLFIKPTNKSGSYQTYRVQSGVDYQNFLSKQTEGLANYLAQIYIDADLYHADIVVFKGQVLFLSARQYSSPNHFMVSHNQPIFSWTIRNSEHLRLITEAALHVRQALGVENGVLHTEFFLTRANQVFFIETNARSPGIGLNHLYQKKLSISFETLLAFIVCGIAPPVIIEKPEYYSCGYYPIKPGRVKSVNLPVLPVAHEWQVYVKPEDYFEPAARMSKAAMFIGWDADIQVLESVNAILTRHELVDV